MFYFIKIKLGPKSSEDTFSYSTLEEARRWAVRYLQLGFYNQSNKPFKAKSISIYKGLKSSTPRELEYVGMVVRSTFNKGSEDLFYVAKKNSLQRAIGTNGKYLGTTFGPNYGRL